MTAPAVGLGTLERLSGLGGHGHPVLSVYLDLDAARLSTPASRDAELEALIEDIAQPAPEADVSRLWQALHSMTGFAYGTRSLAMFSCVRGSVFEAVQLPSRVEPMAVLDTLPWLEPLAGMFTRGDRAVAVLGRRSGRLFRGGPGMLVEFAALHDELHRRHASGSCSRLGRPIPIEEHVDEHARHLAELLLRAHRRQAFDELVVIAPSELWAVIEASLHGDLSSRLAGLVELDLEDAPPQQIARMLAQHLKSDPGECGPVSTATMRSTGGERVISHQSTTRRLSALAPRSRVLATQAHQ
jgi:hypothetical protein